MPPDPRERDIETPQRYAKGLSACVTLDDLRAHIDLYRELAKDAAIVADAMKPSDMPEFIKGLKSERRGKFAGEAWAKKYMAILMPEPMFTVAQLADQYKAPFNVTLFRIRQVRPELLELKSHAS